MENIEEFEYDRLCLALDQSQRELSESFESLQRISGSYCALRSLAEVQGSIGEASFEVASRSLLTAVYAGTTVDTDDMDVSMESMMDTLRKLGDAVIKAITNFFKKLIDTLSNFDLVATWLIRRVNLIERKRIASRGKMPSTQFIELGRLHGNLRVGRIFADDSLKLSRELDHLEQVIKIVSTDYVEAIGAGAGKVASLTLGKSGTVLSDALLQAILQIPFEAVASKLKMTTAPRERFGRSDVMMTQPIIGGSSIFFMKNNLVEKGLKGLRFYGYFYESTTRDLITVQDTRQFKTLSPADLSGLPEQMTAIIKAVSKASNGQTLNRLNRIRYDLENYVRQQTTKDHLTADDMNQIRKVVSTLTYWTQCLCAPLFSKSMSVIRSTLVYCEHSISTYK